MDKVVLLGGNGMGAPGTPDLETNGKKEDMSILGDIKGNCELSKKRLFQSLS